MKILEALSIVILLKKPARKALSLIRSESELITFLNEANIEVTEETIKSFKAIIPTIYNLTKYINDIDSEGNLKELYFDNQGTKIKRLRNVGQFDSTMKTFYHADCFIAFKLGIDKLIALRFNENWNSPPKDMPLLGYNGLLNGCDSIIEQLKNNEDLNTLSWTKEQLYNIFEKLYGFNPAHSANNGLYTLILELDESNFGKNLVPVHPISNIESSLVNAGISKNTKPNLSLKYIKTNADKHYFDLYNKTNKLKSIILKFNNNQLSMSSN